MKDDCALCKAQSGPVWRDNVDREPCRDCGQVKDRVLDLHHTGAVLCSLECERGYWLGIVLG